MFCRRVERGRYVKSLWKYTPGSASDHMVYNSALNVDFTMYHDMLTVSSHLPGFPLHNRGYARTKFSLTGQPVRFIAYVRTQIHPGDEVYIRATLFSGREAVDSVVCTAKRDISGWTRLTFRTSPLQGGGTAKAINIPLNIC